MGLHPFCGMFRTYNLPLHSQIIVLKLNLQETLTFGWCLNEDSIVRYEATFHSGANFWCFLWHLTKPLPRN
jgi:hypothetical protein